MKTEAGVRAAAAQSTSRTAEVAPVWARMVATFFGIGHLQPGPGTWASAATVFIWLLLTRTIVLQWQAWTALSLVVITMLIGTPAATRVARASGLEDPQFVVIDEVAGQLITLIAVPVSWKSLLLGFILFRGFDIAKPPPIRNLEYLPGGLGIMMDDVVAGLFALMVIHVVGHFGLLPS
jgi:phosphatidylglycerophosphatase A